MSRSKKKFYAVWAGRKPGVYDNWETCFEQIHRFENALYKGFPTKEMADLAFNGDSSAYIGSDSFQSELHQADLKKIGEPIEDSICVDGAWNTITLKIEYQGVIFPSKERLFHFGPVDAGTNNIAEFLAIVHALAYCKNNRLSSVIYSDSKTAITWVKKKRAKTKIEVSEASTSVLNLIQRAEKWLAENHYTSPILKWETAAWGENPADFGRK